MISCNLFSEKEQRNLQNVVLKKLEEICIFTLHYEELDVCAFIQLMFNGNICITITTGDCADNIRIINESDFAIEKETYNAQEGVEMKGSLLSDFNEIAGQKLIDINCIQKPLEEYYWQLNFCFQKKVLRINSAIDELKFSIDNF